MELFTQRKFSSTLNPDAPSFVPLAYRTVEDFSDPWWALFHSSPSFRDYWLQQEHHANQEQYQEYDPAYAMVDDLLADDPVLPEDDDSLFNDIFLADKPPFASYNYSGFEEEDNYREFNATEQEVVEFPRYAEKLLDFNMTPKMMKQPTYNF